MADLDLGRVLVALARGAIGAEFGLRTANGAEHAALDEPGATFVTLRQDAELRGCIGSLEPRRKLALDVRANAVAAAFRDPAFSAARGARVRENLGRGVAPVRARADGVRRRGAPAARSCGRASTASSCSAVAHRATFLPQVWESLPEPRAFVAALKRKAGLPADFRGPGLNVARYTVVKWTEHEFETGALRS